MNSNDTINNKGSYVITVIFVIRVDVIMVIGWLNVFIIVNIRISKNG